MKGTIDTVLMGVNIGLDQLMFLHQILHRGQVFARVFTGKERLDLSEPEVQVLHRCDIRPLFVCLLELHSFLGRLLGQILPLLRDGGYASL